MTHSLQNIEMKLTFLDSFFKIPHNANSCAIASSRSSYLIRCWPAVSLAAPSVDFSSKRSASAIHERMDLGSASNCRPAAATFICCSVTSLMASLLNSSVNKRRGIRFMETPNKLIKYHQLALTQYRV